MRRIVIFSLLAPVTVMAHELGDSKLTQVLGSLINLLNSGVARSLFTLAIIGVGYGWLYMGQIPKGRAVGAVIGIGIVFSASWIAKALGIDGGM